jgi:hypothetical protein
MPDAEAKPVNAWTELMRAGAAPVDEVAALPGAKITTSVDVPNCPRCDSPAVKLGRQDRGCNTCGLTWTLVSEQNELDAKAGREVRSRGFNEDRGRGRTVPKGANRW